MSFFRLVLSTIPYLWILLNLFAYYKSYNLNNYNLFGGDQVKMLEYILIVYPFQSTNIAYYDITELLFFSIIPVYLYIVIKRLVASFFAD
jgi:hypothetical protein